MSSVEINMTKSTQDRGQSKTLLTVNEHGSKIARNSVFNCHLLPVRRQMAFKNNVSNNFLSTFVDSNTIFDCHLSGVKSVIHYFTELLAFINPFMNIQKI